MIKRSTIAMRIIYALLAIIIYYMGISIISYAFGGSFPMVFNVNFYEYYMIIIIGIFIAMLMKRYLLVGMVGVASIVGHAVNLIINRQQGAYVDMRGGMVEWFILLVAIVVGVITEFIVHRHRKFHG